MDNLPPKEKTLKEAIAKAIVFFDLFDRPLTALEIHKFLFGSKATLEDVSECLDSGAMSDVLEMKNGFYFLKGRTANVEKRLAGYNVAALKFKIAKRAARWLNFVPGLRLAAVCNSLALGNVRPQSDIDLFIVTRPRRIWITRLLVTAVVGLLGSRRHNGKISDKICLSFYVSEDNMDLKPVTLPLDPYFYYWLGTLVPVIDKDCFARFGDQNRWLNEILPNIFPVTPDASRRASRNFLVKIYAGAGEAILGSWLGELLEKAARYFQLKKMAGNKDSVARAGDSRVVISDTMLKFHEKDRRQEYKDNWEKKLAQIFS